MFINTFLNHSVNNFTFHFIFFILYLCYSLHHFSSLYNRISPFFYLHLQPIDLHTPFSSSFCSKILIDSANSASIFSVTEPHSQIKPREQYAIHDSLAQQAEDALIRELSKSIMTRSISHASSTKQALPKIGRIRRVDGKKKRESC